MRLVHRVSLFFLAALAISLVGNGVLLYGLARHFQFQRFDQQLVGALNTLVAAVEVEEDDVKFEPSDHTISVGAEHEVDDVRWIVFGETGTIVDHSRNLNLDEEHDRRLLAWARDEAGDDRAPKSHREWKLLRRRLAAPRPKPPEERDSKEFAVLTVAVARDPIEIHTTLRQLMVALVSVSLGIWLLAAFLGTTFCRRALQPVSEMANRARDVRRADFQLRLPVTRQPDELSEFGDAFNGLLDQLQKAFEQQRRFTSEAAHQLRTPLTVFLGQIDVALRRPRSPEDYRRTLEVLRDQGVELCQILETLLFLARGEGESELPDVDPRDPILWLRNYRERWRTHVRFQDLKVEVVNPPAFLSTSWSLVAQVLDNLVDNAFKYSLPGTSVTLILREEKKAKSSLPGADSALPHDFPGSMAPTTGGAIFEVRDLGRGVSPQDQLAIFDPFVRTEESRQSGVAGTGLGLAIAARIARALGGTLRCDSRPGMGSSFCLRIPSLETR